MDWSSTSADVDDDTNTLFFNSTYNNNDIVDHDWDYAADQHTLSPEFQIGLFFLYGINIVVSVTGNCIVIVVFSCGRKSRTELAPFLINLAISDLIMAVFCMPFTSTQYLLGKWVYPHFLCPAVTFMQHTSVSSSIYTQAFISIDRLRSIYRPFRTRGSKTSYELLVILGFIWAWASLLASVQFRVTKVTTQDPSYEENNSTIVYMCLESWGEDEISASVYSRIYTVVVLTIDYVFPLLCIGCAYTYVGRKLWERTTPGEASDQRDKNQLQSKRKVIKMLALMVLSFGILWLPLHAFFVLHEFSNLLTDLPPKYFSIIFVLCHFIAMMSVICNIIIYVLVNNNFKSDFRHLVTRHCIKRHSEAHRQAMALRRTPAFHGYHYHRRTLDGYYSKDNSHSSPMLPFSRPVSAPYDRCQKSNNNKPHLNGSSHHVYPNATLATNMRRSPRSLPNMRTTTGATHHPTTRLRNGLNNLEKSSNNLSDL